MLKIENKGKHSKCLYIRIETNRNIYTILKAKEWDKKRAISPKHYNPFLKKCVIVIYI